MVEINEPERVQKSIIKKQQRAEARKKRLLEYEIQIKQKQIMRLQEDINTKTKVGKNTYGRQNERIS